jgi:hypothetical protein
MANFIFLFTLKEQLIRTLARTDSYLDCPSPFKRVLRAVSKSRARNLPTLHFEFIFYASYFLVCLKSAADVSYYVLNTHRIVP